MKGFDSDDKTAGFEPEIRK